MSYSLCVSYMKLFLKSFVQSGKNIEQYKLHNKNIFCSNTDMLNKSIKDVESVESIKDVQISLKNQDTTILFKKIPSPAPPAPPPPNPIYYDNKYSDFYYSRASGRDNSGDYYEYS